MLDEFERNGTKNIFLFSKKCYSQYVLLCWFVNAAIAFYFYTFLCSTPFKPIHL